MDVEFLTIIHMALLSFSFPILLTENQDHHNKPQGRQEDITPNDPMLDYNIALEVSIYIRVLKKQWAEMLPMFMITSCIVIFSAFMFVFYLK